LFAVLLMTRLLPARSLQREFAGAAMLVFKKFVAAIVMVLSIMAVVVLIASLFGSWVVRGRLETSSIDLLLAGENMVATTQERLV